MYAHFNTLSFCTLTALAAVCSPAQAAPSKATASIEQFRFELVDLDLSDGVTPSISFTQQYWEVDSSGGGQRQTYKTPATTSITTRFGAAGGSASDTGISSSAKVNHPVARDGVYHKYSTNSYRITDFILSPNTQMIFTALGTVSDLRQGKFDSSVARISMQGKLLDESGGWMDSFSKSLRNHRRLRHLAHVRIAEHRRTGAQRPFRPDHLRISCRAGQQRSRTIDLRNAACGHIFSGRHGAPPTPHACP